MWSFSGSPGRPLLLLLLLPLLFLLPWLQLTVACPESCSCLPGNSIMCSERRSSVMPDGIPATTKNLYVFENGISTLSQDDFARLDELEMLALSQNQLVELPDGVFGQLSSLRNLDLSSNQIAHISEHSFSGLRRLERLYLYSNRIQSIHPDAFKGLDQLLELKLQQNELSILPPLRLPRLLLLDVSHNRIPAPAAADLVTPNLESLAMADLGLSSLDEELMSSLTNLHVLDLSQNKLTAMPPALRSVRGLIRLNLASNQLGQLAKEDFQNLVALRFLDLSNLNLQGFPEGFFQLFPRLNQLTVAGNPFNCLCPLAWFPAWVRGQSVELARREETRCHFPPSNSGKVLADLEHRDFGCPVTTTTVQTRAPVVSSTPAAPLPPTARTGTTTAAADPPRVARTPSPPDSGAQDPAASPSTAYRYHPGPADKELMCPSNICLNGGTCKFNAQGQVECLCPPDTTGLYCENRDESPSLPALPEITAVTVASAPEPDISARHVTSTSIHLDLNRYIKTQPHIRAIRLTYRNLSGPDQRPQTLNIPATYPDYTLRGLRPNCTYSVCANSMDEPGPGSSCTEARTTGAPVVPPMEPRVVDPVAPPLVLALAGLALVMVVTAVVAALVFLRRRNRSKSAHVELDGDEPTPLELEGVKACLENGALPQKVPEISPCPPQQTTPNGVQEYEALLMQGQANGNNNVASLKPSYF